MPHRFPPGPRVLQIHPKYIAAVLAGLKRMELSKRPQRQDLRDVYLMAIGTRTVYAVADLAPSYPMPLEELLLPSYYLAHQVPPADLRHYAGERAVLHCSAFSRVRPFAVPVPLSVKHGPVRWRRLDSSELPSLDAACRQATLHTAVVAPAVLEALMQAPGGVGHRPTQVVRKRGRPRHH